MGEDITGPEGLVISVNQIQRKPYSGGLSATRKLEQVQIQLTFVNAGKNDFQIDPLNDFTLNLSQTYPAVTEKGIDCLDKPFHVNPGTQSRGTLFFKVNADDTILTPKLVFKQGVVPLAIVCDEELCDILDKSKTKTLDIDSALKLSKFFIAYERYDEAKKILSPLVDRYSDPRLNIQMASIEKNFGNQDKAAEYISRIKVDSTLDKDDALSLARQAFDLDQYAICMKVLEPMANQGRLTDKDLIFLARCYYFSGDYDRSGKLLNELQMRGFNDKNLYFTLGSLCEKKKDWKMAISWWEKAYDMDPKYYQALYNIGVAYYKLEDNSKAAEAWRKVLTLSPDAETRDVAEEALKNIQ